LLKSPCVHQREVIGGLDPQGMGAGWVDDLAGRLPCSKIARIRISGAMCGRPPLTSDSYIAEGQRLVHPCANQAQRMACRHELVKLYRTEQDLVVAFDSSHPSSFKLVRRLLTSSPIQGLLRRFSTAC
jgi:hypothetical protein